MVLTGKHMSRRTALRGLGATIALPLLDSMVPARAAFAQTAAGKAANRTRLVCIEQVHGAAGCSEYGATQNFWNPAKTGQAFDLSKGSLSSLEPFRKHLTIVSNTDTRMAEAFVPAEVGGDHFRSSAVMFTHARPKLTEGSDVKVGTSMDQLYVQKFGQDTPIPSMQLSIEPVDQSGGCAYGYACVYTDTISWAAAGRAAADGARPAHGVRAAVRRRRHAGAARGAARDRSQHPRHADRADGGAPPIARTVRPAAPRAVRDEHPRDRTAHRAHRSAQPERRSARAARRAGRRARIRSKSTSS